MIAKLFTLWAILGPLSVTRGGWWGEAMLPKDGEGRVGMGEEVE